MIQRIQSVYILVAAIFIGFLLALPLAEIAANGEVYVFKATGVYNGTSLIFSGIPILGFIGLIWVLHFVALLGYKKRIRQMRVLVFTIILMLGLFGLMYYFTYASFENEQVAFKIPVVFPLVAIILDYLAIRAIGKDEAMIRSIDRIR